MTTPSIKTLSGAAAAAIFTAVAFMPSAKAACWWNGYGWNCTVAPPAYYPSAPAPLAYPAYPPAYPTYPVYPTYPATQEGRYPGPKPS